MHAYYTCRVIQEPRVHNLSRSKFGETKIEIGAAT